MADSPSDTGCCGPFAGSTNRLRGRYTAAVSRVTRKFLLLSSAFAAFALGGCEKPLLSESDERSPFDRYDTVRNQYAEQFVTDEFGQRRPNLRGRLAPKD